MACVAMTTIDGHFFLFSFLSFLILRLPSLPPLSAHTDPYHPLKTPIHSYSLLLTPLHIQRSALIMDAPSQPLSARSPNTHLAVNHDKANDLKAAPATINSMEYHRQVLQGKLESGDK